MSCLRVAFFVWKKTCTLHRIFVLLWTRGGDFILTARLQDGAHITLTGDIERQHLKELRRSSRFYCPHCTHPLHLKVGDIVIPHFAHHRDATCTATFSEGETKEHLLGKRNLYEFFKNRVTEIQLEPFIKELSQRPDLLVTQGTDRYAIEFQCSAIPIPLKTSRSAGYVSEGIIPLWILCTPSEIHVDTKSVKYLQLNQFRKSFLLPSSPEGPLLLTFNPKENCFHYFSSLLHVAGNRYIVLHRVLSSSSQTFPFACPKIPTEKELSFYLSLYLAERIRFLKSRILVNRKGINDPFLRACYELRIRPDELPNWIGVPVRSNEAFKVNDCQWQLALIRFMYVNEFRFKTLTDSAIRDFVQTMEGPSSLKVKACMEYREFLVGVSELPLSLREGIGVLAILKLISDRFLAK